MTQESNIVLCDIVLISHIEGQ